MKAKILAFLFLAIISAHQAHPFMPMRLTTKIFLNC